MRPAAEGSPGRTRRRPAVRRTVFTRDGPHDGQEAAEEALASSAGACVPGLSRYYAEPAVRMRILEYCGIGGKDGGRPDAVYLQGLGPARGGPEAQWELTEPVGTQRLDDLLDGGADVSRSLWDRRSLLFHFDIDYFNTDYAGEPFTHPAETFSRLEPVYRAVRLEAQRLSLDLIWLMTGRGYHLTGRVPLGHPVVDALAGLVTETPGWCATERTRLPSWLHERVGVRHARAHTGLGLLIEYFAHRCLRRAARRSRVPLVFNGTVVGSGLSGRAAISLDFSFLGDPLDVRHIRVAFGGYQAHRLRPDVVGPRIASAVGPMVAVPRGRRAALLPALRARQPHHACLLARHANASIPDASAGVARLLRTYRSSALARFHRSYLAVLREPLDSAALERRLSATALPACVRWPLAMPNDRLLQPAFVQHVVRALLARGWRPHEIAALIHGRYAHGNGWSGRWRRGDPQLRARFDVRVFAGLVAAGSDAAVDFNCVSAQEKGLCPRGQCAENLADLRDQLFAAVRP